MSGLRRQGRIHALQLLYQSAMRKGEQPRDRELFWRESHASKGARRFAEQLAQAALAHQDHIDTHLEGLLEHWRLGRLPLMVRVVLRLAVCERIVLGKEADAVVIDEAIELARHFMDEDSARFVNGVLARSLKQSVAEASALEPKAQATVLQ